MLKKNRIPLWLISAGLYGFSWSRYFDINISFLAWFAFVPLFFHLENKNTFWSFYKPALLFSSIAHFIANFGFLMVSHKNHIVIIGALNEYLMASVPFALLFPFKKKLGFKKSLLIFPFLIGLWEWIYQQIPHNMGYAMISHSQAENIWLVQYIDIFGVWAITVWTMIFNVLIFFIVKKHIKTKITAKKILILSAIMLAPPLLYAIIRYNQLEKIDKKTVNITLVSTNFPIQKGEYNYDTYVAEMERQVYIIDSVNYYNKQPTDLYVLPEGAVNFGNDKDFKSFIKQAIADWKTPILTGMNFVPDETTIKYNRAMLISDSSAFFYDKNYYDKNLLVPLVEYFTYSKKISEKNSYFTPSDNVKILKFKTQNDKEVKIGTPICLEQNFSKIWNEMSNQGAEFFIQLSNENWWILKTFEKQMAQITNLRSIETRRYTARCSNGGTTEFIDFFGKTQKIESRPEGAISYDVFINDKTTFFTRNQNFFPIISILIIIILFVFLSIKYFLQIIKNLKL